MERSEAIKVLKDFWSVYEVGTEIREAFETLIPELKESEDERIRKSLVAYFAKFKPDDMWDADFSFGDIVAWLEKQGEHQKFLDKIQIGDKVTRNPDGVLVNFSQLKRMAEKGSQNLANSAKTCKVESKFRVGDTIRPKGSMAEFTIESIDAEHYYGNVWSLSISAQDDYELVEQKPADNIIEEEKPLLEKFKQAAYDCAWGKVTCKAEGETKEEYANRFAERFLLIVRDWADDYIEYTIQQKLRKSYDKGKEDAIKENSPAWSDEDKEALRVVTNIFEQHGVKLIHYPAFVHWLKTLPVRITFNPYWKPSDEQMQAFKAAIDRLPHHEALHSLYIDLKKLKG